MKKLLLLILLTALISSANAQWELCVDGVLDLSNQAMVHEGGRLYSGGAGGLYYSDDCGTYWNNLSEGINKAAVHYILAKGDIIILGSNSGVYISTNKGNNWAPKNYGLSSSKVYCIGENKNVLFAGTSDGVYISADNGETWKASNTGIEGKTVYRFLFLGDTIIAGTIIRNLEMGGVFLSLDGGKNWTFDGLMSSQIFCLKMIDNKILAATYSEGVYTKDEISSEWYLMEHEIYQATFEEIFKFDKYLFAAIWLGGVFISDDSGENWYSDNTGLENTTLRSLAICGEYLVAGTFYGGMYRRKISNFLNATSVEELKESELFLFPNPAENTINLISDDQNQKYFISDLKGRICQMGNYTGESIIISQLPKGMYFISLEAGKKYSTKCFIKN